MPFQCLCNMSTGNIWQFLCLANRNSFIAKFVRLRWLNNGDNDKNGSTRNMWQLYDAWPIGVRSGLTTPTSRPTSALSHTSSTQSPMSAAPPVMRANRVQRKPRPMSIAGSAPARVDIKTTPKPETREPLERPARTNSAFTIQFNIQ